MPRKIIYFDRETIKNMLQERNRGTKIKTTGVEGEANVAVTAKAEASSSIYARTIKNKIQFAIEELMFQYSGCNT